MRSTDCPDEVQLEHRPCPNGCSPADEFVLEGRDRINGVPGSFPIVKCLHCGLMRTNPRPTPETIGAYYPADYAPYQVSATKPAKVRKWHHRVKDRIARFFGKDVRRLPDIPPGRMLEIGCASGDYLVQMRERGWQVEGVEFSDVPAHVARQRGLTVQTGTVESALPPKQPADVLAAWMVLEHLHEPIPALRKLREWVKPDGYMVGAVPDADAFDRKMFGSCWYALHLPAHLYHYTPTTFRKVLAAGGWDVVALRWQANPNNLLNTLEWWAQDRQRPRTMAFVQWLKTSRRARRLRKWLGWTLAATRQSGRMEFWARPSATPPGQQP